MAVAFLHAYHPAAAAPTAAAPPLGGAGAGSAAVAPPRSSRAGVGGCAAVAATAVACGVVLRSSHGAGRRCARPHSVTVRAVDDATELAREAAKLRAEAEELEKTQAVERRKARAEQLLDGRTKITAEWLCARLKETEKLTISNADAQSLLSACGGSGAASVELEELSSVAFEEALEKVKAQTLAAEKVKKEQEMAAAAKAAEEQRMRDNVTEIFSTGNADDDRSAGVRALSCLAYLLPLIDGIGFATPLLNFVPDAVPLFALLLPLTELKNSIPFGTFLFLIGIQYIARDRSLPPLLRFNLYQALVLDVMTITPLLFQGFLGIDLPGGLTVVIGILNLGAIIYSLALTAFGKEPDGLGAISDATKRNL